MNINRLVSTFLIAVTMTLAACVTINLYFPEAAAEKAADRFIRDVLGEQAPEEDSPQASGSEPQAFYWSGWQGLLPVAPAHAQSPDIEINTPQIRAIKERMRERQRDYLGEWFDAGAIGLSGEGLVEILDRSAVPLSARRELERVVNAENSDRNAVYREIAVANGEPGWEDDIRATFARRWIANARPGWRYQNADGEWVRK